MKTTNYIAILAVAALSIAACNKDEFKGDDNVTGAVTVSAAAGECKVGGEVATKADFNESGNLFWQEGDAIGVIAGDADTFTALTLEKASAGKATGNFSGEISGTLGTVAVYPYNENHNIKDGKLYYSLPASYTYDSVDADWFMSGNSANAPAYGTISTVDGKSSAVFKHLGGVLCVKVTKLPAAAGKVTIEADRYICGSFPVDLSAENPVLEPTDIKTSDIYNNVSIVYSGAEADNAGVFYFPMPTGTYSIKVGVESIDATPARSYTMAAAKSVTIERRDIKRISLTPNYEEASTIEIDGHEMVNLGLAAPYDKLLWATCNLGATSAADYGKLYFWGDVKAYQDGQTTSTQTAGTTVWNANDVLPSTLDAATQVWGTKFRTPKIEELAALKAATTWTFTEDYNGSGINGYVVANKENPALNIFLPASGMWYEGEDEAWSVGEEAYYWSATASKDSKAYQLYAYEKNVSDGTIDDFCCACAIRPVAVEGEEAEEEEPASGPLYLYVGDGTGTKTELTEVTGGWYLRYDSSLAGKQVRISADATTGYPAYVPDGNGGYTRISDASGLYTVPTANKYANKCAVSFSSDSKTCIVKDIFVYNDTMFPVGDCIDLSEFPDASQQLDWRCDCSWQQYNKLKKFFAPTDCIKEPHIYRFAVTLKESIWDSTHYDDWTRVPEGFKICCDGDWKYCYVATSYVEYGTVTNPDTGATQEKVLKGIDPIDTWRDAAFLGGSYSADDYKWQPPTTLTGDYVIELDVNAMKLRVIKAE